MMKKKILMIWIALLAVSFASAQTYDFSATAPSGQTLYYKIVSGEAHVVRPGTGSSYNNYVTGSLTIPSSVSNEGTTYAVTTLDTTGGYGAFDGCSGLTSVTIPYSVTSIGNFAFHRSGLTSVTIPNSVTSIGGSAFSHSSGLTSVNIPNSVTSMGGHAFAYCSGLTSVTIETGVTSIVDYTFHNCSALTSVTIPNSVTNIGNFAFYNCSALDTLIVGNGLTTIGTLAFSGDSIKVLSYNCPADIPSAVKNNQLHSVTIGNAVTSIANYAFHNCSALTSVTIPNSVTSIGYSAFENCSGLTSVTIGSGVTSIGNYAFRSCSSLDTVYMKPDTPPTLGGNYVFIYNASSRVFIISSCAYDNYYNSSYWSIYSSALRQSIIDINFNVSSSNMNCGTASVVFGPDSCIVRCDSTVVIQATANYGYHFDHWSNGRTANPDTLQLMSDSSVVAYFERNNYTLTANVNDAALGSVSFPNGDTAQYQDTLMVTATPVTHHHVATWSGDGIWAVSATKDTVWVLMDSNHTVTCVFVIDTHTVMAVASDVERGIVLPSGTEFAYGELCTVLATAYTGYSFHSWSNGETANPYTFAVLEDVELTAIFLAPGEEIDTITVVSADSTMGSATVNGNATASVMSGTEVTLAATPNSGYHFVRWDDNNTEATRTITVTSNMSFTAYFEADGGTEGIEDIDASNIKVNAADGRIVVEGTTDEVRVYDMMGRMITHSFGLTATSPNLGEEQMVFNVPTSGVYLIKVGILPAKKVVVVVKR